MVYRLIVSQTFAFVIVALFVFLAALACLMFLVFHQFHSWHALSIVPGIIYPHS
ncbi:hypothetical protein KSZ_03390 [Dictyobacter formicarum]|uniref:Uncharacterized protein n=1 Tax=Dictyobacter formicarum TaxID=2778368 RepID=A0ABQ3V926_9CHLR|nr:hypothetical protein KSZ_03390 [Dictyobacter formicarum]